MFLHLEPACSLTLGPGPVRYATSTLTEGMRHHCFGFISLVALLSRIRLSRSHFPHSLSLSLSRYAIPDGGGPHTIKSWGFPSPDLSVQRPPRTPQTPSTRKRVPSCFNPCAIRSQKSETARLCVAHPTKFSISKKYR
uniref:(northern house mosquito) hypothetical protein n=1 Tax=Culex pipiens TaxID=7175 RepID=A0A8D8A3V0_CULPI